MNWTVKGSKIYVVLVICFGLVFSVWIIQSDFVKNRALNKNEEAIGASNYRPIKTSDDWQKILTTVDNNAVDTSLISKNTSATTEVGTTLTDQMSIDFLSQYLLAVKNNGEVSSEDALKIAQNTLSIPDYTKSTGAKYIASNLNLTDSTDYNTLRIYRDELNKILKLRSSKIKDDPLAITLDALSTENEKVLLKLDYIINENRGLIRDLLGMRVPKTAAKLHLDLLNAASNTLTNLEAMRNIINDPVRGLAGTGAYAQNFINLSYAIQNFVKFFKQNL